MGRDATLMSSLIDMKRTLPPHLRGCGHGFAVVTAAPAALNVEFVCIPRAVERAAQADGGPVSYRVAFRVPRWSKGEAPQMTRSVAEGKLPLVP